MADQRVRITLSVTLPGDDGPVTTGRVPHLWLADKLAGIAWRMREANLSEGDTLIYDDQGSECGRLTMEVL